MGDRRAVLGTVLVACLWLAACSGSDTPAATDTEAESPAASPATDATTPTPTPAATPVPTDAQSDGGQSDDARSSDAATEGTVTATDPASPSRCDPAVAAAAVAGEPTTVRIWHALNGDIVNYLQVLVGQFEAEHPGIEVEIEKIISGYPGTIDEFVATPDDELPDILIGTNQTARLQADSGRFIPVGECTGGATPDNLTDLLPVIARTFTVDGVLWAAPFNTSAPLMLYDRKRWTRAGLDPDDPPADFDELEKAIRQLRDSGEAPIGALLYDRSAMWFLDQPAARTDRLLAEPANGRDGLDIERFVFDTPDGIEILARLRDLNNEGYIRWIGVNESGIDDLSQMVHPVEPAGITFNTSAVLGDIMRLLDAGGIPDVEVGAASFPGPGAGSTAGGGAWWLHDRGDPIQAGAAWTVIDWFSRPELIADIAAYTGYVPTTRRAAQHPITQARWAEYPVFRVAYDQLAAVPDSAAGAGLQAGPLVEVYRNLEIAALAAINDGRDPADELRQAEQRSLEIVQIYADALMGR